MLLSELCRSATTIAIYGLAKNTGKTVAFNALVGEFHDAGVTVGLTSIGRDGETVDAIDDSIAKPPVHVHPGTIVATTGRLLSRSGLSFDTLEETPYRTPLGRVVVVRLREGGALEIAGPSAAGQIRRVNAMMAACGARKVIVDGAINRRCASAPSVADAVVVATGAVLDSDIDGVVNETVEAVRRIGIPEIRDAGPDGQAGDGGSFGVTAAGGRVPLPPAFGLTGQADTLRGLRAEHGPFDRIVVRGAVCAAFLDSVVDLQHGLPRGRGIEVVAPDSSHLYLDRRPLRWYERRGIRFAVLRRTRLNAITVNPVAPPTHRFDSEELRRRLTEKLAGIAIRDVLHASYAGRRPGTAGFPSATPAAR